MRPSEKVLSTFLVSNLKLDQAWHGFKKNVNYQIKASPPFERGTGQGYFCC